LTQALGDANGVTDQIVAAVAERFGLTGSWIRVLAGERSIAFRLDAHGEPWFVKIEPRIRDEQVDEVAALVELAASHGVPTARPRAGIDGRYAHHVGEVTVTVAAWATGTMLRAPVTRAQAAQVGTALGRLHRAFAQRSPLPTLVTAREEPWLAWDRPAFESRLQRIEALVRHHGDDSDGFDQVALETLAERRSWLDAIGNALTRLPRLTRQVGHGDFAAPNLLFEGDRLAAVVDFTAGGPKLLAYELGRIAYGPEITLSPDSEALTRAVLEAYRDANPAVREADVANAGVCAFIQLARSGYPLDERYGGAGQFPDDLDDFWLRRHRTASHLLARMPTTDQR
jgi:homoserine kinase type II